MHTLVPKSAACVMAGMTLLPCQAPHIDMQLIHGMWYNQPQGPVAGNSQPRAPHHCRSTCERCWDMWLVWLLYECIYRTRQANMRGHTNFKGSFCNACSAGTGTYVYTSTYQ